MNRKPLLIVAASVILIAGIAVFYGSRSKTSSCGFFAMDTYCSVKAEGKDAQDVCDRSEEITMALESDYLSRQCDSSEISGLNGNNGGTMSDKFSRWTEILLDVSEKSRGSFDFTLGALSDLWGFGKDPSVPPEDEIKSALDLCGAGMISVEGNNISFPEGIVLDAGASGKGIALDEIKESCLEKLDIKSAVVSIGGSILLYGDKTFKVGIRNPETGNGEAAVLSLDGCCVSTSGSYERFFEEDGRIYHHILDPKTGYPVENGLVSVTVVSESGILSDALSTACFVLGPEEGMKLALDYGCEAVFIDSEGGITVSEGLADRITVIDDNYFVR